MTTRFSYLRFALFVIIAGFLWLNPDILEAQCAMCRTTVENNHKHNGTTFGSSLNAGILYLLVMPYVLISVGIFIWYRKNKQKNGTRSIKNQQYV